VVVGAGDGGAEDCCGSGWCEGELFGSAGEFEGRVLEGVLHACTKTDVALPPGVAIIRVRSD
jgi:hypothetical protein